MRHPSKCQPGLLLVIALLGTTQLAYAGKLDRAGSTARGSSSSSNSSSSSSSSSLSSSSSSSSSSGSSVSWGGSSGDGGDPVGAAILLGYGLYYTVLGVTAPWWGPHQVLEADQPIGTAQAIRFADYPYAEGAKGFILRPPTLVYGWDGTVQSESGDQVTPRLAQHWSGQLGAETGLGVNDGMMRFGLRARVQLPMRIQFDSDWSLFREHDREGVDIALMGREHLSVRFAESSAIQFYSGVGPQHFCDSRGCLHGIDVTWGFEAFPGRPFLFALEGAIGNLEQAFAPGIRTRLGYFFGPVEASVGWHQRWVGGVPLGGPFVGLAGWF